MLFRVTDVINYLKLLLLLPFEFFLPALENEKKMKISYKIRLVNIFFIFFSLEGIYVSLEERLLVITEVVSIL